MIAVDTGFFYALADASDAHHAAAAAWQHSLSEGWITTWPVLTEACHLLAARLAPACAADLMQEVADGTIQVWNPSPAAVAQVPALMKRYARLPMDLADASLVLLAEHLGHGRILTTDRRDFGAYRWKSRKPFQNLLESQPA
jgi:predicted nucleic acid-binding protein